MSLKPSRICVRRAFRPAAALALGALTVACNNGSSSATTPSTTPTYTTEILTGTVAPPVNGALQNAVNDFTVGQGGGQVSVTLTSAVETLPGGALLPTVAMGVGVGTASGASCTILTNGSVIAQAGGAVQLSGTVASGGIYCVQVSDVSNQLGPVAYAVAVTHP